MAEQRDRRFEHGLVVGRFHPPHAGHHFLIDCALAGCRRVTVCVLAHPAQSYPLEERCAALAEMHPTAHIVGGADPHPVDSADPEIESRRLEVIRSLVPAPVDALWSSQASGERRAAQLGARHLEVERDRLPVPVSSSEIRADPAAHWGSLSPRVRATLVRKVVVTGAESTGKTSLCKRLAENYKTQWVPEFGRELTVVKLRKTPTEPWQPADFSWIAAEQERLAGEAARRSAPLLLVDTDSIATQVWEERYLERSSHATERIAAASRADLYLLALPDVPLVRDGVRDGDQGIRRWMTGRLRELLVARNAPVVELAGSWAEREAGAIAACDALLARGWEFNPSRQ